METKSINTTHLIDNLKTKILIAYQDLKESKDPIDQEGFKNLIAKVETINTINDYLKVTQELRYEQASTLSEIFETLGFEIDYDLLEPTHWAN